MVGVMRLYFLREYMISIKSHITISPKELRLLNSETDLAIQCEDDDPNFLKTLYKQLEIGYAKFYKMDGLSRLGFLGAEFLLKEKTKETENCDLLFINKHASLAVDTAYQESLLSMASPALFVYTLPNIVQGEICIRHKIYGENYTFIEKEFSPEKLYETAETMLATNNGNNLLLACLDYKNDNDYELLMLHLVKNADNQAIKFNLQNLKSIFESLYK